MLDRLQCAKTWLTTSEPTEPSAVSVRKQLDRILESATFCSAPGLSRFLRHLVEQAIDGNSAPLKEYSVGVEVFDRGSSFDPRIDTIVRVQARKLRAKLSEYYATEGYDDAILIEVPKGQYVAAFSKQRRRTPASIPRLWFRIEKGRIASYLYGVRFLRCVRR